MLLTALKPTLLKPIPESTELGVASVKDHVRQEFGSHVWLSRNNAIDHKFVNSLVVCTKGLVFVNGYPGSLSVETDNSMQHRSRTSRVSSAPAISNPKLVLSVAPSRNTGTTLVARSPESTTESAVAPRGQQCQHGCRVQEQGLDLVRLEYG
ncbi:hypothetical protein BGZ92_000835, partial [Podila epicladia]